MNVSTAILPNDSDPDVKVVRKAFRKHFEKIAESEVRLDDALVEGIQCRVGIEGCFRC